MTRDRSPDSIDVRGVPIASGIVVGVGAPALPQEDSECLRDLGAIVPFVVDMLEEQFEEAPRLEDVLSQPDWLATNDTYFGLET